MAITAPYTFVPATVILSSEMNSNFAEFESKALDKTGDTMTGTLTARTIVAGSANAYDIGESGTPFRSAYFGTTVTVGSTAVSTNVSVGGTLGVTGVATFATTVNVTGDLLVNSDRFTVDDTTGNATVLGNLVVDGELSAFGGLVTIEPALVTIGDGNADELIVNSDIVTFTGTVSFSGGASWSGALSVSTFGTHVISAGGTGTNLLYVRNTTAGTANYAEIAVGNDLAAQAGRLIAFSSTWTTNTYTIADGVLLQSARPGGLTLNANDSNGRVRVMGIGESTAPADAGSKQAALLLSDTGGGAGNGGALEFGFGGGTYGAAPTYDTYFASIKGWGTDASNNTKGDLRFYTRPTATDSSLTEVLRVAANGDVQGALQPGVLAVKTSNQTFSAASTTVTFSSVVDGGTDYDTGTSTFTAPVAGRYLLMATVLFEVDAASTVSGFFAVGANAYSFAKVRIATGGDAGALSGGIILNLAANDTVLVRVTPTAGNVTVYGSAFATSAAQSHFDVRLLV